MDKRIAKSIALITLIVIFAACSTVNHSALAAQYRLDMGYEQRALKQIALNMTDEALASCHQTKMRTSECFAAIAVSLIAANKEIPKGVCEKINPQMETKMTKEAFDIVYSDKNTSIQNEINYQLAPSKSRQSTLQSIRNQCESQ